MNKNIVLFLILFFILSGCQSKITEVESVPLEFPNIHFYDQNDNEINDTLFVNFNSMGVIEELLDKVLYFTIKVVIKYDDIEKYRVIDEFNFNDNLRRIVNCFDKSGARYTYLNMSILAPSDSIIFVEDHYISKPLSDNTQITNSTIFIFEGDYYATESESIFGKSKSFIIYNIN